MTKLSMTVDDAVEYSGVGRTKLYELFKEKKLTALKCGRRTLVLREELDAFIRSLPVAA
jgi:excisionase family DNA binding protein